MFNPARRLSWGILISACLITAGCATPKPSAPPAVTAPQPADSAASLETPRELPPVVTFAATGGGPQRRGDWSLLPQYFASEKASGQAQYLIHTGGLCDTTTTFDNAYSASVAKLFRQSSIPVIFVPGATEWTQQVDPWAAKPLWDHHFVRFQEGYPYAPRVTRQSAYPENITWTDRGVVFIGLSLVDGPVHDIAEWSERHQANADWVAQGLRAPGDSAYAAVVFAQARPAEVHEDFFLHFVPAVTEFRKPVLYLHGGGAHWETEEGWRAPNLIRIQVDQVTNARPVHIMVSPENSARPFSYDRHGAGNQELQ